MKRPNQQKLMGAINNTLGKIRPGLGHTLAGGTKKAAGKDDVYEVFLLLSVLQKIKPLTSAGFQEHPAMRPLDFKRGPGDLKSTPKPFSYVSFSVAGRDYEAHTSTMVTTKAAPAPSELDVSILDGNVRNALPKDPTFKQVRLFIEAKYYTNDVELKLGREYVGLAHRMRGKNCFDMFVTSWGISPSAMDIVSRGRPRYRAFEGVLPGTPTLTAMLSEVYQKAQKIL